MHRFLLLYLLFAAALFTEEKQPVCTLNNSAACTLVNQWFIEGSAAGNIGDYYDNRDRGHALLNLSQFPQLTPIVYNDMQKKLWNDYGAQWRIRDKITIGNSSTASRERELGSNVRREYYHSDRGINFLNMQYRNNNLYIYPAVNDVSKKSGDLLPTNTPYVILSKGASGSDIPFLKAFFLTLAAFDPKVKKTLAETGLLMPTMQAIFRKNLKQLKNSGEYLTGKANPSVFDAEWIDSEAMVKEAHNLTKDEIPPLVQIKELKKPLLYLLKSPEDDLNFLADSPSVIARILVDLQVPYKATFSAEGSFDINDRPLTYHWVLLRGDPERVRITPSDGGKKADIEVSFHPWIPTPNDLSIKSPRVDIGVFADNGKNISAPAFITFYSYNRLSKKGWPSKPFSLRE